MKLGKEPLAASLWFGGFYGSPGIKMESGTDGKFHGALPNDGWWEVDVDSSAPAFKGRTRGKVEAAGQERAAYVTELRAANIRAYTPW